MNLLTPEIAKIAKQKKANKKGYVNYLAEVLDCSREDAVKAFESFNKGGTKAKIAPKKQEQEVYRDMGGYKINLLTNDYLFELKSTAKTEVFPKEIIEAIVSGYSNVVSGGLTINQLSKRLSIPRNVLIEVKTKLGLTHDSSPLLKEDIQNKTPEELLEYLTIQKEFNVLRKFEDEEWKKIVQDAKKYREIELGQLKPFIEAVQSFDPADLKPVAPKAHKAGPHYVNGDVLLISVSDLHYGLFAQEGELFFGKDFSSQILTEFVEQYFSKIKQYLAARKHPIRKAVIVSCGDILHSLTGKTMNNTPLRNDLYGIDQFKTALESLTQFIQGALDTFDNVEVYSMNGNHAGFNDGILFLTLEKTFRLEERIKFNVSEKMLNSFVIDNTYVLITHGASGRIKNLVPQKDPQRFAFYLKAINEDAHRGILAKSSIVIQGDQHHLERVDYGPFEFVMLPSAIAGCEYADHKGFNTKPKQICFVLDYENGGIKEQIDFRLN